MTPPNASPNEAWPEAMATVLSCTYEAGAGRALAFGVPTSKHFRITFNYWANGELHTDTFSSEKAVPQGTLFPITYNPDVPHQHSHSETSIPRNPLLVVGIIGSVILTTAWFFVLRGCR
ncbi:MAG: hypothetical protein ABI142_08030 [Bryocella sp.]